MGFIAALRKSKFSWLCERKNRDRAIKECSDNEKYPTWSTGCLVEWFYSQWKEGRNVASLRVALIIKKSICWSHGAWFYSACAHLHFPIVSFVEKTIASCDCNWSNINSWSIKRIECFSSSEWARACLCFALLENILMCRSPFSFSQNQTKYLLLHAETKPIFSSFCWIKRK